MVGMFSLSRLALQDHFFTREKMHLIVARFAPLRQGLVPLQRLLPQEVELFHVNQLQRQVQRRFKLLHLLVEDALLRGIVLRVGGVRAESL